MMFKYGATTNSFGKYIEENTQIRRWKFKFEILEKHWGSDKVHFWKILENLLVFNQPNILTDNKEQFPTIQTFLGPPGSPRPNKIQKIR